jgi:hypothetical protein
MVGFTEISNQAFETIGFVSHFPSTNPSNFVFLPKVFAVQKNLVSKSRVEIILLCN